MNPKRPKMKCEDCIYRGKGSGFNQKWICLYILIEHQRRGCGFDQECTKHIEGEPLYVERVL